VYHPSFLLRNPVMIEGGPMYQTLSQMKKFFEVTDHYRYIFRGEPLPAREPIDETQEE
jgi:hypothetical protein